MADKSYDKELKRIVRHSHSEYVASGGAAGGDLSGTYPNPSVNDDSHNHTTLVPYTGATAEVDLGAFGVATGQEAGEGYVYAPDATTTNIDGGALGLYGGASNGSGTGGNVNLYGGGGGTTGTGGDIVATAGSGGSSSGGGGSVSFTAGSPNGGNSTGGSLSFSAGAGRGSGDGGVVQMLGASGGATGNGSSFSCFGGSGGSSSGAGGDLTFVAGSAQAGNSNGGNVIFRIGSKSGSGSDGTYQFQGGSGYYAIVDPSAIASSSKTFTFPNTTGTFALETAASGSFTTVDGKTVTVVNGIITSIV